MSKEALIEFISQKLDGDDFKAELAKVSKSCNPERFVAIIKNYIKSAAGSAKIIEALGSSEMARRTFLQECVKCAADGLVPDGKEAVINTSYSREHGTVFQYMPMVMGIIKTMTNTGMVHGINTEVICENDKYEYDLGSDPFVKFQKSLTNRGAMIAAFASVKIKGSNTNIVEIMTADEVNSVASRSRSKKDGKLIGPWATDTGEMWRKTVLRRLSKRLPRSNEQTELLDSVLNSVDEDFDLSAPTDVPNDAPKAMPKGLEKVAQAVEAPQPSVKVETSNEVF